MAQHTDIQFGKPSGGAQDASGQSGHKALVPDRLVSGGSSGFRLNAYKDKDSTPWLNWISPARRALVAGTLRHPRHRAVHYGS